MRRDERGFALPSPVVLLSVVAVVLAAVAWFVTRDSGGAQADLSAAQHGTHSSSGSPHPKDQHSQKPAPKPAKPAPPPVDRSAINVMVYNNTDITGLAGSVGSKVQRAGWHFVGADDWHGTIPATTIYYGDGLKRAAHQLSLDLGITRIYPADPSAAGMLPHGLTVILLGPLS